MGILMTLDLHRKAMLKAAVMSEKQLKLHRDALFPQLAKAKMLNQQDLAEEIQDVLQVVLNQLEKRK